MSITRARKPEKILQAAADYIREHGWTKGELQDKRGRVCAIGALCAVVYGDPEVGGLFGISSLRVTPAQRDRFRAARNLLKDRIDGELPSWWNDRSTKAEVLAVLDPR